MNDDNGDGDGQIMDQNLALGPEMDTLGLDTQIEMKRVDSTGSTNSNFSTGSAGKSRFMELFFYTFVLVVSYFMLSGALDSSHVLQLYPITSLASPMTCQ